MSHLAGTYFVDELHHLALAFQHVEEINITSTIIIQLVTLIAFFPVNHETLCFILYWRISRRVTIAAWLRLEMGILATSDGYRTSSDLC